MRKQIAKVYLKFKSFTIPQGYKLIGIVTILVLSTITLTLLFALSVTPSSTSPIATPDSLKVQAVEEELDYLDGAGEIKWYDNFFTWNPRAQYTSYPFITGTIDIYWDEPELGIKPVSVPATNTSLVVELVFSSTTGTGFYTQTITYSDVTGQPEPGTGLFYRPVWVWMDNNPGIYREYINPFWMAGGEKIQIYFVRNGQVITPTGYPVLYRDNLVIPDLIYLPVVAKGAN